jgi:cephalosporin-C deacetylase-like acetyl esterase
MIQPTRSRKALLLLPATVLVSLPLLAQLPDAPWRAMLESGAQVRTYLERAARSLTDRAAGEIASPAAWDKVRQQRGEELRDSLGLLPWPARTPLNARVTGVLDRGDYTVEKLAFESMPKVYVTANLYMPKQRRGKVPGVIYVCGHSIAPQGAKTKYQRHGISFARNGYACMIVDPIQIAETFALHHGIHSQEMYDWYARGYTPAGPEVWNAMRAIDYLETRPEVDSGRVGITGRSGGAAMSWFTAAVDPRVKVVAPAMGISTYAEYVRHNTQKSHCDCMFQVNSHGQDALHIGGLIAPRALLMVHGKKDTLFPVPGYEEFERKVGALYQAYGRGEAFRNIVVDSGHADSDYQREEIIKWFDRFLLKVPERKLEMAYRDAEPDELAVFGARPPADARNFQLQEFFTLRPAPRVASAAAWQARRKELLDQLRNRVLPPGGAREPEPRVTVKQRGSDSFEEREITSDAGVSISVLVSKPRKSAQPLPALLYVASDGEDRVAAGTLLRGVSMSEQSVRTIVYPRGVGEVPWSKTLWKDLLRNAMLAGETIDSMRLRDVLTALEMLKREPGADPRRILLAGKGVSGALALYAAVFDEQALQVLLIDPPPSHRYGPILFDVLRYTDLPEVAAMLAPRHLTFYGHMPEAYQETRRLYRLAGAQESIGVSMSIQAVLDGRYHHNFGSGL